MKNVTTAPGQHKVLLLEDELELQNIIREGLEAQGFKVLTADSLADVQFKLKNQAFDAIVMDMRVKGGDSSTVLEALVHRRTAKPRATEPMTMNARAPLIMMSAYFEPSMITRLANATPHLLVKPFSVKDLVAKLRMVLEAAAESATPKSATKTA